MGRGSIDQLIDDGWGGVGGTVGNAGLSSDVCGKFKLGRTNAMRLRNYPGLRWPTVTYAVLVWKGVP